MAQVDLQPAEAPRAQDAATPCALIAGGGSGGHVFPGLAVASELATRGWQVAWAGAEGGMEKRLVERHGLPFHALPARPMVGRGAAGKARAMFTLALGGLAGRRLVRRLGARVVLGTGGYVSAPAVVGARLAGLPSLLLEPNADAGFANRALSRLAREALVAHPVTAAHLRCPVTLTGVPVRAEFFDVSESLPWGQPIRLLVLGGSQGAAQLNRLLPAALERLAETVGPLLIRHQTGKHHLDAARGAYLDHGIQPINPKLGYRPDGPHLQVELRPFLHDMAGAMAESHLIVSRAGAITLAEICAAGRPSLLVPLALAAGHQESNARQMAEAGAAEVLTDDSPTVGGAVRLAELLEKMLTSRSRLDAMAEAARRLGHPDAAGDIARRLEHWAGEPVSPPTATSGTLYLPAALGALRLLEGGSGPLGREGRMT